MISACKECVFCQEINERNINDEASKAFDDITTVR